MEHHVVMARQLIPHGLVDDDRRTKARDALGGFDRHGVPVKTSSHKNARGVLRIETLLLVALKAVRKKALHNPEQDGRNIRRAANLPKVVPDVLELGVVALPYILKFTLFHTTVTSFPFHNGYL